MTEDKDVSLTEGLTTLQLIGLDAGTRCNECLNWCPVLDITQDESLTTPEKIRVYGELVRAGHGLRARLLGAPPLAPEVMEKLTEALYTCTTCGRCGSGCGAGGRGGGRAGTTDRVGASAGGTRERTGPGTRNQP